MLEYSSELLSELIKENTLKESTLDIDATYTKNKGNNARINYKGEVCLRSITNP